MRLKLQAAAARRATAGRQDTRLRPAPILIGAGLRRALLRWFGRAARPLPWRKTRDPYAIWVSEVMLQQTQVATVLPFYRSFLRAFPTVYRLARAGREQVLKAWAGLGYYRRALSLHRAARTIARDFDGEFPRVYARLRSLPGIGDYTARALLSIAFGQPTCVVDGNVTRVIARLFALPGRSAGPRLRRLVERKLECLLSRRMPGEFNQALMELGQTVCLPRAPRCPHCPLRMWCRAYRRGNPTSYPMPRRRRAGESTHLAAAVIRRDGQVALARGLDEGLLAELWNFPSAFGNTRARALARLKHKLAECGLRSVDVGKPLGELHHGITYRSICVHLYPVRSRQNASGKRLRPAPILIGAGLRWFPVDRLENFAASRLTQKIAAALNANERRA